VSLALGIGANTAIYSVFDQILRRPLRVPEPERLVNFEAPPPKPGTTSCSQAGSCDAVFSYPIFRDLERTQTVLSGVAAHGLFGANLAARGQTMSGDGLFVSRSYLSTLGCAPQPDAFLQGRTTRRPRSGPSRARFGNGRRLGRRTVARPGL
jgi:hypothetical protein